ncbi:MAG: hypothetical protein Q8O24_03305 [Gallionellaceae bacterium]|nr:hypothetical protein [Gallionellaceae bacterium]
MKQQLQIVIFSIASLHASLTLAGPADYVYTPTVEQGEKELDFKYGTAQQKDGTQRQAVSLGIGYGANEYWFTEVYFKQKNYDGQIVNLAEWENKFQLTETGKYFLDVGLIVELEAPINSSSEPKEIKIGPLLQKEIGKLQLNANFLFERAFGTVDESGYSTECGYQWQAKYRLQPSLELGLQGMGELGKWDNWDAASQQNHRMGPAVFGKFSLGNKQAIKYNAAWLFGASNVAPSNTVRMQLEYEF